MAKSKIANKGIISPLLFILFIISLVMYFQSPLSYDFSTCVVCLVLYLIAFFLLELKVYRGQLLSFDLFFSLSFVYVNFVYPVFLYNVNANFSLFNISFNERYITRCACLALVGYTAYALFRSVTCKNIIKTERKLVLKNPNWVLAIFVLAALVSIVTYISFLGTSYDDTQMGSLAKLMREFLNVIVFYIILTSFYNSRSLKEFIHKQPIYIWLLLGLLVLLQLLTGYRTDPMRYALVFVLAYSYFCKKIPAWLVVVILIVGMIAMQLVGSERNGGNSEYQISDNALINMGEDLIINNRSLYVLTEHADKSGYSYGKTFMMNVFSIVPFAQSVIPPIIGWNINDMSTGLINTYLTYNVGDEDVIGLGTNLIGDLYYAFGLLGVIVFMGLLGALMSKAESKMYSSFGYLLIYALFFANAVYYPRAEYFNLLRILTWSYVFYLFANGKKKKSIILDSQISVGA